MDCTNQTHRLEDVLTPPSVTTDGCAPYHRFKSFAALSVLYIYALAPLGGGGGGGGGMCAKLERGMCGSFKIKKFQPNRQPATPPTHQEVFKVIS